MLAPTHSLFGVFLTLIVLALFGIKMSLHWTILAFAIFGSILPDIDHTRSYIGKLFPYISKPLEERFGHRMVTHSFYGWAVSTLLFGLVLVLLHFIGFKAWSSGLVNWRWIAAFSTGYMSHLLIDMLNTRGVPLLWPEKARYVVFKNPNHRIDSGSRFEWVIMLILVVCIFLSLPLTKYGLMSSLRWMLANSGSAIEEYKAAKTVSLVEFTGYYAATKQPIDKGEAEILDVENKRLIVFFNGQVYTLSDEQTADITASKVRVKKTEKPITIERKEFKNESRINLLYQIPRGAFVSGTVHLPENMQIKFPTSTSVYKTMEQKGNDLLLSYASKDQIEKLALTESFDLQTRMDQAALSKLYAEADKVRNQIDEIESGKGLTSLGKELLLGKEGTEKQKIQLSELTSQLNEINVRIEELRIKMKARKFVFSGEVYLRQ